VLLTPIGNNDKIRL